MSSINQPQNDQPIVTVITPTTGNELLSRCYESVARQTYKNVQHLIVVDGKEREFLANTVLMNVADEYRGHPMRDLCVLPYATGKDRYNGHRIYGAFTFIAKGEYIVFLDEDNFLEPTHIEDLVTMIQNKQLQWGFSFRNIWDENDKVCEDNCESLGLWRSILGPTDFFVDVNCYMLSKPVALSIAPIWYRKFREPGQVEIDRAIMGALRQHFPKFDGTRKYTVNYQTGNTELSVKKEFFIEGNKRMLEMYGGSLPWKR